MIVRVEPVPRTTPRAPRESRRIVTVLFADIVGFTTLVESHAEQTEALRTTLQRCFDALGTIVLDHGGIVEKFIGDAICALFGAPVVHEDDPARALACALAMQAWIEELNDGSDGDSDDVPLTLRIGVSTGEVVGGTSEHGGQEQYSVTGDAVNTASRLQTAAQPGQVVVGEATERLTRGSFNFEPMGEVLLKGKELPEEAFILVSARTDVLQSGTPFVNRRRERERLQYCLELASAGEPQLLEIVGDAGIGKSSLVNAFIETTRSISTICYGSCPAMAAVPLHPFHSIIDALLKALPDGAIESPEVAGAIDLMQNLQGGKLVSGVDVSSESIAAAGLTLVRACPTASTVVIVENVHRADPDSLDLLQCLITRIRDEKLLLLWTRRTGEESVGQGDHAAAFTRLSLKPLSEDDSGLLLNELLRDKPINPAVEHLIVERSGGNPLYIEAMVSTLLDDDQNLLESDGSQTLQIPTTVRGLIQARLDGMPEAQRLVAQEAAVVGREFDARLLQAVDLFGLDVAPALEALAHMGMIERVDGESFAFRHVLTQEVCYETMLQALRSELHREVADAIPEMFPDRLAELAPVRADHYAKGGDTDRAVEVLIEAGGEP